MLKKGDKLPDISLEDQDGKTVTLHSFIGKPLVIYFYPKNNTRVCTAQACGFRDNYEAFLDLNAEIIGISADSTDSHKKVADKRNLPFILLSDAKKEARKAFGLPSILGLLPGRVTFIVDKEGIIKHTFRADFNASKHIEEALKVVQSL
ncbi:peroxiredoxin [Ekhidna sp.]|uniref:peroxiredoxin n=1 Tax=Ekhidna sp. TaxID=2608089 RepID=UPI00351807C8